MARIGNESVPIQLAQCRFPGLAISSACLSRKNSQGGSTDGASVYVSALLCDCRYICLKYIFPQAYKIIIIK